MRRLGIMGGTFNPIHHGHLLAAQEAMDGRGLAEVLFLPNRVPPHRQDLDGTASAWDRFAMTCLAVNGNDRFRVSAMELERAEVSYTFDTLALLREQDPARSLVFLTGADSLLRSPWYRLDDLLGLLEEFVVVSRPGAPLEELGRKLDELGLRNRSRVVTQEIPAVPISSTDIRDRIQQGRSFRYLVPEPVHDYIRKNRLYLRG